MRVLLTGSRDWADEDAIDGALYGAWSEFHGSEGRIVLVHGDCPTGADAIADRLWRTKSGGEPVETHPADWSRGRKAGPERNAHMVSLGADLCLAFIGPCTSPRCHIEGIHASHGATGCADLAEAAGIKTVRYYASELAEVSERQQRVRAFFDSILDFEGTVEAALSAAYEGAKLRHDEGADS